MASQNPVRNLAGPSDQHGKFKVMLYLKKRPDISDEQFHNHWKTFHVELALENNVFKKNTRRYSQLHNSPELKEKAKQFGIPTLEYDGIAEVWVDSIEEWVEVVSDPLFLEKMVPDEGKFIEAPIHIMLGQENLVIGQSLGVDSGS